MVSSACAGFVALWYGYRCGQDLPASITGTLDSLASVRRLLRSLINAARAFPPANWKMSARVDGHHPSTSDSRGEDLDALRGTARHAGRSDSARSRTRRASRMDARCSLRPVLGTHRNATSAAVTWHHQCIYLSSKPFRNRIGFHSLCDVVPSSYHHIHAPRQKSNGLDLAYIELRQCLRWKD